MDEGQRARDGDCRRRPPSWRLRQCLQTRTSGGWKVPLTVCRLSGPGFYLIVGIDELPHRVVGACLPQSSLASVQWPMGPDVTPANFVDYCIALQPFYADKTSKKGLFK